MVIRAGSVVRTGGLALAAVVGFGPGCNWTTFDDLADETAVDRVVKPNDSRQYGQVVVAMPEPSAGGGANLVVLGRSSPSLSTLRYDALGKRTVNSIKDFVSLGFAQFPENPPVVAVPGGNRFAFPVITGTMEEGQGRVIMMNGDTLAGTPTLITFTAGDVTVQQTRIGALAFGAVKLTRPPQAAPPADPAPVLVVGRGNQLNLIMDYDTAVPGPDAIWGCTHGPTSQAVFGAVVADVMNGPAVEDDDAEIIVGIGDKNREVPMSEIRIYSPDQLRGMSGSGTSAALSPCADPLESATMVNGADAGAAMAATKFNPAATLSDLVYSAPAINTVFVRIGDTGVTKELTITNVGSQFGYALAVGNLDDDPEPELVVGAPRSNPDGVTDAGAVYFYDYDVTTGEFTQTTMYTTSSPSASERYGKSVAIVPWTASDAAAMPPVVGKNVLVVGAEGKVFTYFRTGFYDDVRTGR